MRTTIDIIDLDIVFHIIPFAHPCIICVRCYIHQEDSRIIFASGISPTYTDNTNIGSSHGNTHTQQAFRYSSRTGKQRPRMVFHRRLHILDKILSNREYFLVTIISTYCIPQSREHFILLYQTYNLHGSHGSLPVAHLEHFTYFGSTAGISLALSGYESPCTNLRTVLERHMTTLFHHHTTIRANRLRSISLVTCIL